MRSKQFVGCLLLAAVAGLCCGCPPPGGYYYSYDRKDPFVQRVIDAKSACESGRYEEAIASLNFFIEQYPDGYHADLDLSFVEAWVPYALRAGAHFRTGNYEAAIADYDQAARTLPEDHDDWKLVYEHRGIAHFKLGAYDRAISDFTACLRIEPTGPAAGVVYGKRGQAHFQTGDYEAAAADYDRAAGMLTEDQIDVWKALYEWRGTAHGRLGAYDRAISDFTEYLRLDSAGPATGGMYVKRAHAYFLSGQLDKARADVAKCRELGYEVPDELVKAIEGGGAQEKPDPLRARIKELMDKGDHAAAIKELDRAIELSPEDAMLWHLRAFCHFSTDEFTKAINDYSRTIELRPDAVEPYYFRAHSYAALDDLESALADLNKVIDLNPDAVAAYLDRATIYQRQSDFDNAILDATRAIERKPDFAKAYHYRAAFYAQKGELDKARADVAKCVELGYEVPEELIKYIKDHEDPLGVDDLDEDSDE